MAAPREDRVPPFCLGCRYSLSGLPSGDCPECGRPFDLSNDATVTWVYRRRPLLSGHRRAAAMLAVGAAFIFIVGGVSGLPVGAWVVLAPLEVTLDRLDMEEKAICIFAAVGWLLLIAAFIQRPGPAAAGLLAAGGAALFAVFGLALHYAGGYWVIPLATAVPFLGSCAYAWSLAFRAR